MRALTLYIAFAIIIPGCLCNCSGKKSHSDSSGSFDVPGIPAYYVTPADRANWLSAHFWDLAKVNCEDSVTSGFEQHFSDFLGIASAAKCTDSIAKGIRKACSIAGETRIMDLAEKYLYDSDSPLRSENLFITFLESASTWQRRDALLELVNKNREGTEAADFPFETSSGNRTTLREFADSSPVPLMVYFFDSECEVCKAMIGRADRLAEGKYRVLAVCPQANAKAFDEDLKLFPAGWTVVRDLGEIDRKDLYSLPAMPSIYILSPDLTVVAKDLRL